MTETKLSPLEIIQRGIFDSGMKFFTVGVDDDMAAALLAHNEEPQPGKDSTNRKASPIRIDAYRQMMVSGEWLLSPQPLVFARADDKGRTEQTDGQQRLKALRLAAKEFPGLTLPFTVCIDAPKDAKMVLDTGKARTPADFLRMGGVPYAQLIAPAIKYAHCYLNVPFKSIPAWRGVKLSAPAQTRFLQENLTLMSALEFVRKNKVPGAPYVSVVLYFLLAEEYDVFKAEEFLLALSKGIMDGVTTESACWKLREYLGAQAKAKYRFDGFELLGLMILAANDWLLGTERFKPTIAHRAVKAATKFPRLWSKDQLPQMPKLL